MSGSDRTYNSILQSISNRFSKGTTWLSIYCRLSTLQEHDLMDMYGKRIGLNPIGELVKQ